MLNESTKLRTEYKWVELILKILGIFIEKPIVEFDQRRYQSSWGFEHIRPNSTFRKTRKEYDMEKVKLMLFSVTSRLQFIHKFIKSKYNLSFFFHILTFAKQMRCLYELLWLELHIAYLNLFSLLNALINLKRSKVVNIFYCGWFNDDAIKNACFVYSVKYKCLPF